MSARQSVLAEQAALLKQLAGDFSVPVLVTNQITTATGPLVSHAHQARSEVRVTAGQRLVAALGATWAHAVNTRVALLTRQGRRWAEIVKSPACPNMAGKEHARLPES